jgi:hypothetical protein
MKPTLGTKNGSYKSADERRDGSARSEKYRSAGYQARYPPFLAHKNAAVADND